MNKLINTSLAALISLYSQACATSKHCSSIELEHKKRLETCVLYDYSGKPSHSSYTLFNGWNLPVMETTDYYLDGPDKTVEYEYDRHRQIKSKTIRNNLKK